MQLIISGNYVHIESVTFSEKGFGKQKAYEETSYVLILLVDNFINRFGIIYDECIAELIRDDEITGFFHPAYEGATGYPSLEEFLNLPECLRMEMIDAYFIFDILRLYIGEDVASFATKWEIKSLDSLSLHDGMIFICGRAVEKYSKPPVK